MKSPEADGPVCPFLIYDEAGQFLFAGLGNTKALKKTLENGRLWLLDGNSGRLLPFENGEMGSITGIDDSSSTRRYVRSVVQGSGSIRAELEKGFNWHAPGSSDLAPPRAVPASGEEKPSAAQNSTDSVDSTNATNSTSAGFLYELEALVRDRRKTMPEGSYTTHLFKSGLSKIRKKTGEEAVELVLAEGPDEVASEASDLIYHLIVLLVALDVPLERVLADLRKR